MIKNLKKNILNGLEQEIKMNEVFITHAKRTAVGSFLGSLSNISSPILGSAVIKAILAESKIESKFIDEVTAIPA